MKIALLMPNFDMMKKCYGSHRMRSGTQPPLPLAYVAAPLEKANHKIKIIDSYLRDMNIEEIIKELKIFQADIIGIHCVTVMKEPVKLMAAEIKKELSIPIIVGGPHTDYFTQEILTDMPEVDFIAYGEVDLVITEIINNILDPTQYSKLPNFCYRDHNGKIIQNPPSPIITDLDIIDFPSVHLFDINYYRPLPFQYRRLPYFIMITSRGCPYRKCIFCYQSNKKSKNFRRHSPERVIDEIKRET